MIEAKVIEDSVNEFGTRLCTLQLEYPRFIHAELMTHRVFSRNAASSRAVPTRKIIERIKENPAIPVHWGKNQAGMQAREELNEQEIALAKAAWLKLRDEAVATAEMLLERVDPHKQVINRLLEPWNHIQIVLTSTEWDNWFELRDHPDADPNICVLAQEMRKIMEASEPTRLIAGQWHLPYVTEKERRTLSIQDQLKASTARCARVSYYLHDGKAADIEKDFQLHDRLVVQKPIHASPSEHAAQALSTNEFNRNFRGFRQYRDFLERPDDSWV